MHGQRKARRAQPALPPRGLRPRYSAADVQRMQLAHTGNLDGIATGVASETVIWDEVTNALTWTYVSNALGVHQAAMERQLQLVTRLMDRYSRTGRVRYDGPDYQQAKTGVLVMDELATLTDVITAEQALTWAQAEMAAMVRAADLERAKLQAGAPTTTAQEAATA